MSILITKELINKIVQALEDKGVKDSHFDGASMPLTYDEQVVILQNGKNRRIDITALIDSIVTSERSDLLNVSFFAGGLVKPLSLKEAVANVKNKHKKAGLLITFFDSATKQWVVYQYKGTKFKDFYDLTKWKKLLPSHFKGLIESEKTLLKEVPYPEIGDYAYVREGDKVYLYVCEETNNWLNTGDLAELIASIDFNGTIDISDNLTWVLDGVDTLISIYPDLHWELIIGRPTKLSQFDNDVGFVTIDHKHKIEDILDLQNILNDIKDSIENISSDYTSLLEYLDDKLKEIDEKLDSKADVTHDHDDKYSSLGHDHDKDYAAKEIEKAVLNIRTEDGKSLWNPDGITIPNSSGGGGGGGGGTSDIDIITTNDNTPPTDFNVYSALRSLQSFLRKDQDDKTDHLIKFLGGAEFGKFIDSLLYGKGAAIDKEGNAQFQSVEVRSYLKVLELIYNRLNAVEGDIVLTDSGTIESVIKQPDGVYVAKIRKRWDGDFHSFQKDDVIRGVVNKLDTDSAYYTSWNRVIDVDRAANTITLIPYNNKEVPGDRNFPVTESMVVNRWGNAINRDRQSTWYISATEGRIVFLDKVTKPILEDYNYASFWGKPVQLDIFKDKPINYDQPYAYMRGLLVQDLIRVDYNGAPIKNIIDTGPWKAGVIYNDGSKFPYDQHDVWHHNCKWRCIIDGTTEEPSYKSTSWSIITDNNKLSLIIETDSSQFYRPNSGYNTILEATVYHGTEDITNIIEDTDWRWSRETGNIITDNAWNAVHENNTTTVEITESDFGNPIDGSTTFICEAFVRDGKEILTLKNKLRYEN